MAATQVVTAIGNVTWTTDKVQFTTTLSNVTFQVYAVQLTYIQANGVSANARSYAIAKAWRLATKLSSCLSWLKPSAACISVMR